MQIVKMKKDNQFAIAGMSFSELKAIKDACAFYGQQGGFALALKIAQELEKSMDEVEI